MRSILVIVLPIATTLYNDKEKRKAEARKQMGAYYNIRKDESDKNWHIGS